MPDQRKCVGVIDGALIVLENGSMVILDQVKVPRMGLPGGAAMRTILQREVQDQVLDIHAKGKDRQGTLVAQVVVDGVSINDLINHSLTNLGYR